MYRRTFWTDSFCAIKLKRQDYNDWKRTEWGIALQSSIDEKHTLRSYPWRREFADNKITISRKRHTTIDKSKRTASAADLQGHCNLRQNSVSSASSYRVICVRLRGNLHQVTAQSASSYNVICNWLKTKEQREAQPPAMASNRKDHWREI